MSVELCIRIVPPKPSHCCVWERRLHIKCDLHLAASLTPFSIGVLITPLEKFFNCGHSITVNFSKEGNIILQFPELKLVRLRKQRSTNDFNWLKVISSPASLPSFETISVIPSHSNIFIFLRRNRLLAVEDVNKLINPWHFDTFNFVKFWKDTDDDTKVSNPSHSHISSFWSLKDLLFWEFSFQICLSPGILHSFNRVKCSNVPGCCSSSLTYRHISSKGAPFNSRNLSSLKNSIGNRPSYVPFRVAPHSNINFSRFGNVCWKILKY